MTLGIVIVNYHSHEMVAGCLAALDEEPGSTEVFVVDNSVDPTESAALSELMDVPGRHLVTSQENLGFGGGSNRGARAAISAGCTEIMLLNPDMVVTTDAVRKLAQEARDDPGSIISPTIRRPDGSTWFAGGQIDMRSGVTTTRPRPGDQPDDSWLTGACMVMSTSLWIEIGGFDEDYFMYWEDIDLSRRATELGHGLRVMDGVHVTHEVGGTQGADRKSNLYAFYVCRNRLLFIANHGDRLQRLRWLLHTPRASWRIAMRDGRRSALGRPGYLLAALRGSIAGSLMVVKSLFRVRS